MRTDRNAYPSRWAYKLHYGETEPDPPRTLDDGTIRRYDNSHEDTKGHELHVAPEPDPDIITFPGMIELWNGSGARSRKPSSRSSDAITPR
ncbi:DUF6516 family protein [Natronococcus sp. A-GB7]|nr:DUF6516 family protein [Natronococcus sp. A-GB7]MDG5818670.1 DUF6516 family protein [Natronococcus sp. A-GB7]